MSFARSLITVSGLTGVSRICGFIRDYLTALFLGAGPIADAFFVAQRLPNLFRSLFAEGAFSAAFVPLYTTEQDRNGDQAAQEFAGQALMLLVSALLPFSVLIMLFMPQVMLVLAPGFQNAPEKYDLAVKFSTITFPYLALISVTALQTGVLNARGRFAPGAFAPIAFNIVLIVGLFASRLFDWHVGYTLAWAVTISGVVQCAWLAISCYRAGVSIPISRPKFSETSLLLFRRIGPGAIGAGAAQINLLVSTILASTLPTGGVSHLFYADRLNQLPLGIIGIAIATTLLPLLSRHVEAGEESQIRHYNSRAIEFCLLLGLPATIGLIVLAQPIVQTLFHHGAFTFEDAIYTSQALGAYALGVPGFLLVKVFAADFFARHDTKTPVKAAMVAMAANIVLSCVLIFPLQHVGIALANSIAITLNAALHYYHLKKHNFPIGDEQLVGRIKKIIACAAIMAAISFALYKVIWTMDANAKIADEIIKLCILIIGSGISYAVALELFKVISIRNLKSIMKK